MLWIAGAVAAATLLAPVSWAAEPDAGAAATTTTSRPEPAPSRRRPGEPGSLPTGLPGFGVPGPPVPPSERPKDAGEEPDPR